MPALPHPDDPAWPRPRSARTDREVLTAIFELDVDPEHRARMRMRTELPQIMKVMAVIGPCGPKRRTYDVVFTVKPGRVTD